MRRPVPLPANDHVSPATENMAIWIILHCFCFGPRAALLPAFGSFTGNQTIRPAPEDRIYVIAGDEVIEVHKGISP